MNENNSTLSDLQYYLNNASQVIASDSMKKKKITVQYMADPNGENWKVVYVAVSGCLSFATQCKIDLTFDSLIEATNFYENELF